ncbi:hypothetical protein MEX01_11630 [Methylorubrum extorquens]|nr:hypothetical protein MEX01_11630 [Methylorubrum extorquens]
MRKGSFAFSLALTSEDVPDAKVGLSCLVARNVPRRNRPAGRRRPAREGGRRAVRIRPEAAILLKTQKSPAGTRQGSLDVQHSCRVEGA